MRTGVNHGEPEGLRDKEQEKSLNVSQRSQSRDQSFASAVLSSTLKDSVNDSINESVNDNRTVKCDQPGCHEGFPDEEALKIPGMYAPPSKIDKICGAQRGKTDCRFH